MELSSRFEISRIILIGYPDQFPFLRDSIEIPSFFWYQSSKPAFPPGLESTTVVPLTGMTGNHLKQAGVPRIGPVIPHGVDTKTFHPGCMVEKKTHGGPVLLNIGANSRRKRFDKLIEACRFVADRMPEAKLIIKTDANDKPGGFDLKKLAEQHGVSNLVSVIDTELSDSSLAQLYASADIYVHTAEWEGFCIPIIEAMASGLPVVTHPVQGPGELVPYPDLLVPGSRTTIEGEVELMEADPRSFANAIIRFAEDPSLTRRAVTTGRSVAVDCFDIRAVVRQWSQLLRES